MPSGVPYTLRANHMLRVVVVSYNLEQDKLILVRKDNSFLREIILETVFVSRTISKLASD